MFKEVSKSILRKLGYEVRSLKYQPVDTRWGIDPWRDVKRLSAAMNVSVDVAFDVGANVGQTSNAFLNAFETAKVYAFEPHPKTFEKLKESVHNDRFVPVDVAFSDREGEETLYDYKNASELNSLASNTRFSQRFHHERTEIKVQKTTIDAFCSANGIDRIDILKIDTEGHEFSVLRGAQGCLERGKIRFIYFEFNDCMPAPGAAGGSMNDITEYLHRFGFRFAATYTDYIVTEGEWFAVANALVVRA